MKVASASLLLTLPTYWLLAESGEPTAAGDHAFAIVALTLLPVAALLALFGVGLAAFAVNLEVRERWLIAGISIPALIAAAIVLYILANIPPT